LTVSIILFVLNVTRVNLICILTALACYTYMYENKAELSLKNLHDVTRALCGLSKKGGFYTVTGKKTPPPPNKML